MSSAPKSKPTSKLGKGIRELVAAVIWLLAFTKLFIYDVDVYLIDRFTPALHRFLPYRFFIIVSVVALSWILLGNRKFRIFVAYILFYPLVILLWRIPKLVFKNWAAAIVFLPAIESLITTFKWRFIAGSLAMLSALAIMLSSRRFVLVIAMLILVAYLTGHYVFRFRIAFRSSTFIANIGSSVRSAWEGLLLSFQNKEMKDASLLDPSSEEFRKKHLQNLQMVLIYAFALRAIGRKLQGVFSSRKTDLYFLCALLYSFLLTLVLFAFEYFALYKIQPEGFSSTTATSFWTFLLFSFNVIIHAGFASITPISKLAILMANVELLTGILIFVIFVFVILTSNRERYRQELKVVIDRIDEGAQHITGFIKDEFKLTIIEAELEILQTNPDFSQTIILFGESPPALPKPNEPGSK